MVSPPLNELMLNFNLCIFLFHPSSQPHDMPPEHSVSHVIRFFFYLFFFFFLTRGGGIDTGWQHVRLRSGERADMTAGNQAVACVGF